MKEFSLYDDNICPFSRELNVFNTQIFKISFILGRYKGCVFYSYGVTHNETRQSSL